MNDRLIEVLHRVSELVQEECPFDGIAVQVSVSWQLEGKSPPLHHTADPSKRTCHLSGHCHALIPLSSLI
ncbi:MAG: hypothetical protein ACFFD4_17810 [Candidatus Odinarchaeota archaeon]